MITPENLEEMASLRTELGWAVGALLVIYALHVHRGASTRPTLVWIGNAEVLERSKNSWVGNTLKTHMVLDYDIWRAMTSIRALIIAPLKWEKLTLI